MGTKRVNAKESEGSNLNLRIAIESQKTRLVSIADCFWTQRVVHLRQCQVKKVVVESCQARTNDDQARTDGQERFATYLEGLVGTHLVCAALLRLLQLDHMKKAIFHQ